MKKLILLGVGYSDFIISAGLKRLDIGGDWIGMIDLHGESYVKMPVEKIRGRKIRLYAEVFEDDISEGK